MSADNTEAETPKAICADKGTNSIIKRYSLLAAAAGFIPLPMIDLVLIGGIQVKMVYDLARHYQVPFDKTRAKALIGSLVGSALPIGITSNMALSLAYLSKAIPVLGPLVAWSVAPALSSAATYALGKVFNEHFQTGGTLLTFDANRIREHYLREFEAAKAQNKGSVESEAITAE